jgi:L-lactate utilization protein LutB
MSLKKQYYENLADSLIEKFNQRGIEGYYCDNSEEAVNMAKRFLTPGCSVTWGGSMTLEDIGLIDDMKNSDYQVIDRATAKTPDEARALYGKIVTADYYFMSSNAITLDGQLINIDGHGNRVACLITGPKNVIIIAGMNKIVPDVESGIARVRNMAAPPNALRLNRKTPCTELGRCADCLSSDSICSNIVVTRRSNLPNRIKVILVGEELGY